METQRDENPAGGDESRTPERYDGEVWESKPSGFGTMKYREGISYSGIFVSGAPSGIGMWSFANGGTYVGELEGDKRTGQGTLRVNDKEVYSGNWVNGVLQGHGEWTRKDDNGRTFQYTGPWVDGKRDTSKSSSSGGSAAKGTLEITNPDGSTSKYVGEWSKGKRHGKGTLTEGGLEIDGEWENGCLKSGTVKSLSQSDAKWNEF